MLQQKNILFLQHSIPEPLSTDKDVQLKFKIHGRFNTYNSNHIGLRISDTFRIYSYKLLIKEKTH